MGKKKIKKQTEAELLKESEKLGQDQSSVFSRVAGRQIAKGKIYIQAQ